MKMRKIVWVVVSCLMVLSLVIASCAPKEEAKEKEVGKATVVTAGGEEEVEEEVVAPSLEVPQYGGTLTLTLLTDPTSFFYDLFGLGSAAPQQLSHQRVWDGDWAKGPAGGYGTNEVTWGEGSYLPDLQAGVLAESVTWAIDPGGETVTTTIKVRDGVHWALDPNNQYSRLVNGREVTTDDIIWCLDQRMNNPEAMNYQFFPAIHGIHCVKTGPQEIQVTHPFKEHLSGIMRLLNSVMMPPELYTRYGRESCTNWRYDVGTGPFFITDIVPDNTVTMGKNPNYWMKDPIGLGMGNKLPYLDRVRYVVMPDLSTRQAALRTGIVDQMSGFGLEDKNLMTKQAPELKVAERGAALMSPIFMRTDKPELPFYKKEVRRAMMMATDFQTINEGLYAGLGDLVSWPNRYTKAYADLYLGLDDPECPDSVKELYTYNPDRAKELLEEAGYPTGFKTTLAITADMADYYSVLKDQWTKVNINVEFNVIQSMGALIGVGASGAYEMIAILFSPVFTYPEQAQYSTGGGWLNCSMISDPYIDEMAEKARAAAITDFRPAMKITKELMKYVLDQAYCIPTPAYPNYVLWWPWIKNYTGELSVGYAPGDSWVQYVWCDQVLKKSMGY